MKKLSILLIVVALFASMAGCSPSENTKVPSQEAQELNKDEVTPSESVQIPSETDGTGQTDTSTDIHQIKADDDVSIVGQVAGSTLVNGNTLWVQAQQPDGTFVIYHCQLKDEFIPEGEELKVLDVAKVKGLFLSLIDLGQENSAPLVTLYDCEIIK